MRWTGPSRPGEDKAEKEGRERAAGLASGEVRARRSLKPSMDDGDAQANTPREGTLATRRSAGRRSFSLLLERMRLAGTRKQGGVFWLEENTRTKRG